MISIENSLAQGKTLPWSKVQRKTFSPLPGIITTLPGRKIELLIKAESFKNADLSQNFSGKCTQENLLTTQSE
jgi:hypothetical protein